MKKQLVLFFILFSTFFTYAMSNSSKVELITYKNKNGFEFTHKKCQKIKAKLYFQTNIKDLSSLDSIKIYPRCEDNIKSALSFSPSGETYKTFEEIETKYSEIYKRVIRFSKEKGSTIFYVPEKKYLTDNSLLHLRVEKVGMNSGYRWHIKKQCGIIVHALEINVHMPHTKEYEAKITSGEEIIPPEEKKIIDSFKCVEQEKK